MATTTTLNKAVATDFPFNADIPVQGSALTAWFFHSDLDADLSVSLKYSIDGTNYATLKDANGDDITMAIVSTDAFTDINLVDLPDNCTVRFVFVAGTATTGTIDTLKY